MSDTPPEPDPPGPGGPAPVPAPPALVPARPVPPGLSQPAATGPATAWWSQAAIPLALVVAAAALGIIAGWVWAALAPRAWWLITGHGAATLINVETRAFVTDDIVFCFVTAVGGVLSGALGYLLGVRRLGWPAMAGVLAGAVSAAVLARWTGEFSGRAHFLHALASLPAGAKLPGALILSSPSALAIWPLAACLVAGTMEMLAEGRHRPGWPGDPGDPSID